MIAERLAIQNRELAVGDRFYCEALGPKPDSSIGGFIVGGTIEDIRGGGFYGKVLLFENEDQPVIKTTQPDPWHLLWRRINWGLLPFPPQSNELAAKLDYLSATIINRLVPVVTGGWVVTPEPTGYTNMGQLGFGQAIERIHGRGARFTSNQENEQIRKAREQLWFLGRAMGIEHSAQIHPDNPFGKPNIWLNENGQIIWLDTLPAIRHTGFVLPAFYFPFHQEVKMSMGKEEATFNQINTKSTRKYIGRNRHLFSETEIDELAFFLDRYDQSTQEYSDQVNGQRTESNKRSLIIKDALNRGIISSEQAAKLHDSNVAYNKFLANLVFSPAIAAFSEFVQNRMAFKALFNREFQSDIVRFLKDSSFRHQRVLENTTLKGMWEAHLLGLISEEEWNDAWKLFEEPNAADADVKKLAATLISLQAGYIASGRIMNALSVSTLASVPFAKKPFVRLSLAGFIEFLLPSIIRVSTTAMVDKLTKEDLKTIIKVSAMPYVGGYLAVPAGMVELFGSRSEEIWHYTKRSIIASLSAILRPWGGWNSDLEEKLWEALRMEKW